MLDHIPIKVDEDITMYQRTTTASRRMTQRMLDSARMLHVSQVYDPQTVEHKDEDGIVSHTSTVYVPRFLDVLGKKAKGHTYSIGRNMRKRVCLRGGLNHVHMERHHSLRPTARRSFYASCVGA